MILDLQAFEPYVLITAQYSNAVLLAILPFVSDYAGRMGLPVDLPLRTNQVAKFVCDTHKGEVGGRVTLSTGHMLAFEHGHLSHFSGPRNYYDLQEPVRLSEFYGRVRLNREQAVALARKTIQKLGYQLEDVFAELEPRVDGPIRHGTNTVPFYRITWFDLHGSRAADIAVDAERSRVEMLVFRSRLLWRSPPKLEVQPTPLPPDHEYSFRHFRRVNPAYMDALIPKMLAAITEYARRLDLAVHLPVTTNDVARIRVDPQPPWDWVHAEIQMTNGCWFIFRHNRIANYHASDEFFGS